MDGIYTVLYGTSPAGIVRLTKNGLYYTVVCEAKLPKDGIYRLIAGAAEALQDLGILIKEKGIYTLNKNIPTKRLSGKELRFWIRTPLQSARETKILIEEDQPFEKLERINCCKLLIKDGKHWALLNPEDEGLRDNDPNP